MSDHKHKDVYCKWSGNPKGYPAKLERCAAEVGGAYLLTQCMRKCGHGPNGIYCKQHAKRFVKESV